MANHHTEQKRILLKAALISLAIHGAFIALFTSFYKDSKDSLIKKLRPINIKLVEKEITKTAPVPKTKPKFLAQEKKNVLPPKPKPKPKPKPIVNQNVPTPTRQSKVNVEKKLQRNQPTDSSFNQTKISKPNRNIGTNAQKKAVNRISENPTGGESFNQGSSTQSTKNNPPPVLRKETPRCRYCPDPNYPRRAKKRGEEGYVIFRLYVSTSGRVANVQLLESSGNSDLINAARQAAKSSSFFPMALKNTIRKRFDFVLR